MTKVETVKQLIKKYSPQKHLAILALQNYLSYLCDPTDDFDENTVNRFLLTLLRFRHWQDQKQELARQIRTFIQQIQPSLEQEFQIAKLLEVATLQIINIESASDRCAIIERYQKNVYSSEVKLRVLSDKKEKVISLALMPDGSLALNSFGPASFIEGGILRPLTILDEIYYTSSLELDPHREQKLEVSPFINARFKVKWGLMDGCLLRGYTFQKYEDLQGCTISKNTHLFYALKRMEQFFISRESDPLYHDLIKYLDQTTHLIRSQHPQSLEFGPSALKRARLALENIFPNDRTLALFIRSLEDSLTLFKTLQVSQSELELTPE